MKHKTLVDLYRLVFARPIFYNFNKTLFGLSLRGMGVLNFENEKVSGEKVFMSTYLGRLRSPIVLDVGANIGNYSSIVLRSNKDAVIYGFEPHPRNFEKLKARYQDLQNVTMVNLAVGKESDHLTLYDIAESDGSSHASLYRGVIEDIHSKIAVGHKVEVVDLDTWAKDNNVVKIDLLKIDTEGNELAVLKGAKKLLSEDRISAIHFEFNEMNVISRTFFKDFYDLLNGFKFYRLLPRGFVEINKYGALNCEIFAYQNIVAISGSKRISVK